MRKRILTVLAHPDDAETMAGGTLLTWRAEGHSITLCLLTDGDKGTNDPLDTPAQVVARRRVEQHRAAARLGAEVIRLGYPDGALQPTLDLRRDIVRVIRRVRPHVVLTCDPTTWFRHGLYINHPDHRAAGHACVEALYPAVKKPSIFPELLAEGLEPHVVDEVWLGLTDHPDTWVDISDVLDEKIELICEHTSQFPPDPTRKAFSRMARETGAARAMPAAEAFRTLRLARSTVRALADAGNE
ncbi:MAG: PIG-L deacetylase family protein [Acidobacteriota bacterium]